MLLTRSTVIRQAPDPLVMFPSRHDDPFNRIDELGLIPSSRNVTEDRQGQIVRPDEEHIFVIR